MTPICVTEWPFASLENANPCHESGSGKLANGESLSRIGVRQACTTSNLVTGWGVASLHHPQPCHGLRSGKLAKGESLSRIEVWQACKRQIRVTDGCPASWLCCGPGMGRGGAVSRGHFPKKVALRTDAHPCPRASGRELYATSRKPVSSWTRTHWLVSDWSSMASRCGEGRMVRTRPKPSGTSATPMM